MQPSCVLVLGSHINACSVVRELASGGIGPIVAFAAERGPLAASRYPVEFRVVKAQPEALREAIAGLLTRYERIVPYPTNDRWLEVLHAVHAEFADRCYVPFNPATLLTNMNKTAQYAVAEQVGVPCPKSVALRSVDDLDRLDALALPIIVKPCMRFDDGKLLFRKLLITSEAERTSKRETVAKHLKAGVELQASEIVPGPDDTLYTYVCFRTPEGELHGEWTGTKLAQCPAGFGTFAAGSNQAPPIIQELGRKIVHGLEIHAISETEFKLDANDGQYKLMEVNLRPMMWSRMGPLTGVHVMRMQYDHALGRPIAPEVQRTDRDVRMALLTSQLTLVATDPAQLPAVLRTRYGGQELHPILFNPRDPGPALRLTGIMAYTWLRGKWRKLRRIVRRRQRTKA